MNKCDSNARVEALSQYPEKESLPFALDDYYSSLEEQQHNKFRETSDNSSNSSRTQSQTKNLEIDRECAQLTATDCSKNCLLMSSYSQYSSHSASPDLTESAMTDGTSCCSAFSSPKSDETKPINHKMKVPLSPSLSGHTSIMSSILSASSLTSVPFESCLPNADFYPVNNGSFKTTSSDPHTTTRQPDTNFYSIGFSELMKAADDSNVELEESGPSTHVSDHRSNGRLPALLKNQEAECGTLISAATESESIRSIPVTDAMGQVQTWWHSVPFLGSGSHIANRELKRPLLTTIPETRTNDAAFAQLHVTRLLSNDSLHNQYTNLALERASSSVQTNIEHDNSFEVSLLLGDNAQFTVDEVVEVISNADLLNLWCNPIQALIVTSNSSEASSFKTTLDETRTNNECEDLTGSSNFSDGNERIREYEAEWIEATTCSLESPSSNVSFIFSAGQSVLQSLGFTSYGKITMFIERQYGRISITVGPFNGGVTAYHSIFVSLEDPSSDDGRIRIVDRVRLDYDNNEEVFSLRRMFGCAIGSCLSDFFFPSIVGYVDQVAMSMARLRFLLENNENIRSASRHC